MPRLYARSSRPRPPTRWRLLILACTVVVVAAGSALRPVCVPLSADDLSSFSIPIELRTDRDFYIRVFQRRDGRWYQCKTWLSRQFFF